MGEGKHNEKYSKGFHNKSNSWYNKLIMFPTLLQIGPVAVTSLGVFLFLAFLTGSFFVWQKGREENFDADLLLDSLFLVAICSLVGARVVFWLFNSQGDIGQLFNFSKYPGFSFFGGLIGCLIVLAYFCKRQKWNYYKLLDVYVFGIIPAQILLRIGNFLDGSYYGRETAMLWGIKFPGLEKPVHPFSLYEIIFLIVLFFVICKLERQYRLFEWYKDKRGQARPGFLFLTYLLAYSLFLFVLEFWGDSSLYLLGLSWEQWFCIVFMVSGLILFYLRSGRGMTDILVIFKESIVKFVNKKRKQKLKVIAPVVEQRKPAAKKKEFHFKAGMDAKKK